MDAQTLLANPDIIQIESFISENELEMLCDVRAEWDEFDRAFQLAEEFVKIVRGQVSMSIDLWIVRAFDSGCQRTQIICQRFTERLFSR